MRRGPWKRWSGRLAASSGRDFERKLLPFLRLFWLTMIQAPPKQSWDKKGIDLLVWPEGGSAFPCVVQCKGFEVRELGQDQVRQSVESIDRFLSSNERCDEYLFVHNRSGRHREFTRSIQAKLRQLETSGKTRRAKLWDRHELLQRASDRLREILEYSLHQRSTLLLKRFQKLFRHGDLHISRVPVSEHKLIF